MASDLRGASAIYSSFLRAAVRQMECAAVAAIVAVLLAAGPAHAQSGQLGCPCLGTLPATVARVDCDVVHAPEGRCVVAEGLLASLGTAPLLAAGFGARCGLHAEPFNPDCFDQRTGREHTAESGERVAWCDQPWCYVDRTNCDAAMDDSRYWTGAALPYSFETCEGVDLFSVPESAVLSSFSRRVHESVDIFMATPIEALSFIAGLVQAQVSGARVRLYLDSVEIPIESADITPA